MIKVYSRGTCKPCQDLKDWLKENNIEYTVVPFSREAYSKAGVCRLPTVEIEGVLFDGWANGEIRKAIKRYCTD